MLKVLIADDEKSIRSGLKKIIDWTKCGYEICGEASDGQQAVDKIRELKPDLVLLDIKMPVKTGIEVIKEISELKKNPDSAFNKNINFLILSGFSDFEYAQEAVNYGAKGYFVKPIDEDILEEKVREIARESSTALKDTTDISQCFSQLFLFGVKEDAFPEGFDDNHDYQALLFSSEKCNYSDKISELEKKVNNAFSQLKPVILIHDKDVIALFTDTATDVIERTAERFIQRFQSAPFAVSGSRQHGIDGALKSFLECRKDSQLLFFAGDYELLKSGQEKENILKDKFNLERYISEAVFSIETYDKERLSQCLENCSRSLNATKNPDTVKTQCITFLIELQSSLFKKYEGREFKIHSAYELVPAILEKKRFNDVIEIIKNYSFEFIENFNSNTSTSTITKVIAYIKTNYFEDLKLESLGQLFYCNSAYLGKKFKEQTGVQFNNFLDQIRIEEAKKKLTETNLKVYQISKMVGYTNTDYFFMKFKKHTGLTPKEFKAGVNNKNQEE
ncbi:response regulator [Treponema sp.]|uniref:response regulator transcription factor n=1 Tax=Treponema sp. TaxID=166 RepID=UPI0025FEB66C|nr:response regulator [Treponema sp.]MCR5218180.1 response regulator [Treponema sp.]